MIQGEDRCRYIPTWLHQSILERFLKLPDADVIAEAKRQCQAKLNQRTLGKHPGKIIAELTNNKPAIPLARIELAAFLNFCQRLENGTIGTPEDDWLKAEEQLHVTYRMGFE